MLELLGIGVPRSDVGWLLHRVSARFESPGLVAIVSERPEERKALLDAIAGRLVPTEGRVWVDGVPSMRGTEGRVRRRVAEIAVPPLLVHHRSVLWNVLTYRAARPHIRGLHERPPGLARREAAVRALRLVQLDGRLTDLAVALDPESATRVSLARALLPGPRYLVIREPDQSLSDPDLQGLLTRVATLARLERLTVLVSLGSTDPATRTAARIVALANGLLVFDGAPAPLARREPWSRACAAPANA